MIYNFQNILDQSSITFRTNKKKLTYFSYKYIHGSTRIIQSQIRFLLRRRKHRDMNHCLDSTNSS